MGSYLNSKCVVLLTFDFDAESAQVRKTPHLPVTLTKGQFAHRAGLQRVLGLLDKYGIKSTFFVPSWTVEHYPEETKDIARRGHEVAAHGYLHENFSEITEVREREVHERSVKIITDVVGTRPVGFRAPYWEWSVRTLDHVRRCGFTYDSSLMDDDKPYIISDGGSPICELPVEWFLDDWTLFEIQRQSPSAVMESWKSEFEAVYSMDVGYFMLTMHPECIGRASRILMLEQLVRHISSKKDVLFSRCQDLAEHIKSSERK